MNRFLRRPSAVFALIFAWKLALLLFLRLPVPSNDAFFYDGAVVNLLDTGKYANPSLALALPISGTQLFCAYPPLYQLTLAVWMAFAGTSALSAMVYHLVLFGFYMLVCLAILKRLGTPVWAVHIAALFLLAITFVDRPDSLAHLFGLSGIYCFLRGSPRAKFWWVLMVLLGILTFCTSLQLGLFYGFALLLLLLGALLKTARGLHSIPRSHALAALLILIVVPPTLVFFVVFGFPNVWAGFQEHARQTPALTGLRFPRPDEVLKLIRTLPGTLGTAVLLLIAMRRKSLVTGLRSRPQELVAAITGRVLLAALVPSLCLIVASLTFVTPNAVSFGAYLQPVVVGAALAVLAPLLGQAGAKCLQPVFILLAALAAIRAVGLSTWGLACAMDYGYPDALRRVDTQMVERQTDEVVVLSSCYLYEAARYKDVRRVHCDWLRPTGPDQFKNDLLGLTQLKPRQMILTQFDWYRRYEPLVTALRTHPELGSFQDTNYARLKTPDAVRPLRRVLQHISWAPVVVNCSWTVRER